jgi:hypothetical protein
VRTVRFLGYEKKMPQHLRLEVLILIVWLAPRTEWDVRFVFLDTRYLYCRYRYVPGKHTSYIWYGNGV